MKRAFLMTRRQFLKAGSTAVAACMVGLDFAGEAWAKTQDFFSRRLAQVYKHDAEMPRRKSQDNPLVKQIYKVYLEHPLSERSEHLLHTEYVSRSKAIEQLKAVGVKVDR
ncbi:MAG: iron hydrogenase small subunit [Candidatus Omnitrophica bacterium]|nr:iron hydrogenase small subunit [Candidatus Omnitrophota bacterium]